MRPHLLIGTVVLALLAAPASPATAEAPNSVQGNSVARAASVTATSTDVRIDGSWVEFSVGETGSFSSQYSFTSRGPVLVTVTDFLCRGDRYRVVDRSAVLGSTSEPSPADDCVDFTETPG